MVAVALLTLTPLALRPVRLACLIHAANVHSEPGSNPSNCGDGPEGPAPFLEGSRMSDWSHRARPGPGIAPRADGPAAGLVRTAPATRRGSPAELTLPRP